LHLQVYRLALDIEGLVDRKCFMERRGVISALRTSFVTCWLLNVPAQVRSHTLIFSQLFSPAITNVLSNTVYGRAAPLTPDTQFGLLTAFGTDDFNQHAALGPCTPGLTQVKAWHFASAAQVLWQSCGPPSKKNLL